MPLFDWLQRVVCRASKLFQPSGVAQFRPMLEQINALASRVASCSDEELAGKTAVFREQLSQGMPLDACLPEAFAVVREVAWRVLGMRHYDVQVLGGLALHFGNVAEMKTGEGKTLVATLPAYLNALSGKGVHVVTVNDYLAARDAEWMGQIYRFLGLEVGTVLEDMGRDEAEETRLRQAAYRADITYATNSALVFDYLRDNLATSPDERVHRGQHFAIVDEVDLLLIDEVRTPLIISGPSREDSSRFVIVDKVIRKLQPGVHYRADWKTKTASLTDLGWEKVEADLGVGSLSDPAHLYWYNAVYQSVLAHCVYRRDVDYIVKGGQVQLIDEHTGRVSADKRFSDGLHQALEAKEGLRVQSEDRTFARTSYQGYFRLYDKLAGMTGTAYSERQEFRSTYGMGVVVIPTNRPTIRKDYQDSIFPRMEDKHEVIAEEVLALQRAGRPVLVGTCSVKESEQIARLLKQKKIRCQVLNAKNHQREAEIIAQAGRQGAVTISTNMAGRGTDILLGGDPEKLALQKAKPGTPQMEKALARYKEICAKEREAVVAAGGLHVIGTSLHEAERLDLQLRGRSGRQGDPGSSQFIICLEDDIFRTYGEAEVEEMLELYDQGDGEEIVDERVRRRLHFLREKVEIEHKHERTETFKYDQVIDEQRRHIYSWRTRMLEAVISLDNTDTDEQEDIGVDFAQEVIRDAIHDIFEEITEDPDFRLSEEGVEQLEEAYASLLGHTYGARLELPDLDVAPEQLEQIPERVLEQALAFREERLLASGKEQLVSFERELLLRIIDEMWIDHWTAIEHLEDRVHLMGYAQLDPLVLFRTEVAKMFEQMLRGIRRRAVNLWFSMEVVAARKPKKRAKPSRRKRRNG